MTTAFKDLIKPLTSSKLGDVYVKGALRFKKILCDNALVGAELNLTDADFIFFDEGSSATGATMSIDDEGGPQLPVGPLRGLRDMPMKRVFITCTAQAGKVLNAWWGKGVYIYGAQPAGKGPWYDRNPVSHLFTFQTDLVAPHASTFRYTYTVPTGKKAFLETMSGLLGRDAVAAPAARAACGTNISTIAAEVGNITQSAIWTNAVGDKDSHNVAQGPILQATELARGFTVDNSTGGSISYRLGLKVTEFDA